MARGQGDGIHYITCSARLKTCKKFDLENWPKQKWIPIISVLSPRAHDTEKLKREILKATQKFVVQSSSVLSIPAAQALKDLKDWTEQTAILRSSIWNLRDESLSPTRRSQNEKLSVRGISERYFNQSITDLVKEIHGNRRQMLSCVAIGLDLSLALSRYAIQEIEGNKRASEIRVRGAKSKNLWYVWVALVRRILDTNNVQFKPKNFSRFVGELQKQFPTKEEIEREITGKISGKISARTVPTYKAHTSLPKYVGIALRFGKDAEPRTLLKLLSFWGQYDRVKRTDDQKLLELLKEEPLLKR